jgi:hypothetical protein
MDIGKPKAGELLEHLQAEFSMEMYHGITSCIDGEGKNRFLDWFIRLLAENSANSERLDVSTEFFMSPKAATSSPALSLMGGGESNENQSTQHAVLSCVALPCLALPRLVLPCLVSSCLVLSYCRVSMIRVLSSATRIICHFVCIRPRDVLQSGCSYLKLQAHGFDSKRCLSV